MTRESVFAAHRNRHISPGWCRETPLSARKTARAGVTVSSASTMTAESERERQAQKSLTNQHTEPENKGRSIPPHSPVPLTGSLVRSDLSFAPRVAATLSRGDVLAASVRSSTTPMHDTPDRDHDAPSVQPRPTTSKTPWTCGPPRQAFYRRGRGGRVATSNTSRVIGHLSRTRGVAHSLSNLSNFRYPPNLVGRIGRKQSAPYKQAVEAVSSKKLRPGGLGHGWTGLDVTRGERDE